MTTNETCVGHKQK